MKKVSLTQNRFALVSDQDFELINQFKWCVNNNNVVQRAKVINGKRTTIAIHRFLMNPPQNMEVDHINGDRLDNRRENLRICTRSQNCTNREGTVKSKSGIRGVNFRLTTKKWIARIEINGKKIHLGVFDSKLDAALAYNVASKKYFGEFARLNSL